MTSPLGSSALPALDISTHERWFVESQPAGDWSFFLRPLPLALTAAVVLVTVAWRLVALRVQGPELRALSPLGRLVPWVPRLLGIHLGVALLALAATGAFITPSNDHLDGAGGSALLLAEAALGVWLVTGWQLRSAATLVLGLGPALALVAGPTALAECANLAAVAAFLVVVPAGPDAYGAARPSARELRHALLLLRLGVGAALISLAFTEKLTNPAMAVDTLEQAVLVAMVPFNATLLLFGQTEMVGHLPVYGVFLALMVYGSNATTSQHVRWLPSRRPAAAPVPVAEPVRVSA